MRYLILWTTLAYMMLAGCSRPLMVYHGPRAMCNESYQHDWCSSQYLEQGENYQLGFVEIDDKGSFWDRQQLAEMIKTINQHQNVLLLVFAHGWKHNAMNQDRDVRRMRDTLSHLANTEQKRHPSNPRKVLGLYIGWRGSSITTPVVKELSFWERKETAHNAGETATEIFIRLKSTLDQKKRSQQKADMVIVGHSFGGALVYSAIKPLMLAELKSTTGQLTEDEKIADLIVLLNPAFEATRLTELRRVFKDKKGAPYLTVLTADNDRATGVAFRYGRLFSTFFDMYKDVNQRKADRKTIGHYKPYFTHILNDKPPSNTGTGCGGKYANMSQLTQSFDYKVDDPYIKQWQCDYHKPGHKLQLQDSVIEHLVDDLGDQINPDNPIQNIHVKDRDILDNHSNIICDDLVDLIRSYIIFKNTYRGASTCQ